MKLYIRRMQSEKKGLLGGHKGMAFKLYAKVELSDIDNNIVEKYKLGEYVVAKYKIPNFQITDKYPDPFLERHIYTQSIIKGCETEEVKDVRELLELEENIKAGCRGMKQLLQVATSFGGEEMFEI